MVLGDKPAAQVWLDAMHGGTIKADVFFEEGKQGLVAEDARGVVFFARVSNVRRLDTQFSPFEDNGFRVAKALMALEEYLGPGELITDSHAPQLIGCIEKFGFEAAPETFVRKTK